MATNDESGEWAGQGLPERAKISSIWPACAISAFTCLQRIFETIDDRLFELLQQPKFSVTVSKSLKNDRRVSSTSPIIFPTGLGHLTAGVAEVPTG